MSYTPTTWVTGDTITATALNKIENGIASAGGGYDAVIRLTHADNSGDDSISELTPSIESGTFSQLHAILFDMDVPNIRVEYYHPWGIFTTLTPYISYFNNDYIYIGISGYFPIDETFHKTTASLFWGSDNSIVWDD